MSDDWAVVEEALTPNKNKLGYPQALAALARLREREAQWRSASEENFDHASREGARAEAAEARVAEAERERDDEIANRWKLEDRVARLEEALREVLELQSTEGTYGVDWTERWGWQPKFKVIARRALAHEEEKA